MQNRTGLSSADAKRRLIGFGPNAIHEKKPGPLHKFFKWLFSPISLMLLVAAGLSALSGKSLDVSFILGLALLNFFISYWQEAKADKAIEKLSEKLAVNVRTLRDSKWASIPSTELVPDDIVELAVGDIVPADVMFLETNNLSINAAALTGESLPEEKKANDTAYSGSFVATGIATAKITSTGKDTYFGKTLLSVEKAPKRSALETDILTITKFLSLLALSGVVVLTAIFTLKHLPLLDTLTLDLSLIIAGIPVALPTVMALIISLGVMDLAKKGVIVRRLSSLENLANLDLLFSDKTGTLTHNRIAVEKTIPYQGSEKEVLQYAVLAAEKDTRSIITQAILQKAKNEGITDGQATIIEYTPADSVRKRSTAVARINGKTVVASLGAPKIIRSLCAIDSAKHQRFEKDVKDAAKKGYRSLALAIATGSDKEEKMKMVGLILLSDPIRKDARDVINFLGENGVAVKMLTGDHAAIGKRAAIELGLKASDVYAEVLPAEKHQIVENAKTKHVVGVTGDGVNDLPAIRAADVGIAVANAVDAAKSGADIVLLDDGISVIKDAIIESRKIFARLYSYSIYRIAESFRIIFTVLFLGLAFHDYPLSPIQLILLALLNDVPIVSLAFDRVKIAHKPAHINVKKRFILSSLYGVAGVANSILFFILLSQYTGLSEAVISTAFFLKMTVSGHMLIFVAHTRERWWRFLPSGQVIWATFATQTIATAIALSGVFMQAIPLWLAAFVWVWSIAWMQVAEGMKIVQKRFHTDVTHPAHAFSGVKKAAKTTQ